MIENTGLIRRVFFLYLIGVARNSLIFINGHAWKFRVDILNGYTFLSCRQKGKISQEAKTGKFQKDT